MERKRNKKNVEGVRRDDKNTKKKKRCSRNRVVLSSQALQRKQKQTTEAKGENL